MTRDLQWSNLDNTEEVTSCFAEAPMDGADAF